MQDLAETAGSAEQAYLGNQACLGAAVGYAVGGVAEEIDLEPCDFARQQRCRPRTVASPAASQDGFGQTGYAEQSKAPRLPL